MKTESDLLQLFSSALPVELSGKCCFKLRQNSGAENSVMLCAYPSAFRPDPSQEFFVAKVKLSGKSRYIAFSSRCAGFLSRSNFTLKSIKSQEFVRVDIEDFEDKFDGFRPAFRGLVWNLLDSYDFGCCSRYIACSDSGKCVHPDPVYAASCQYRKNLEMGRIFYGKNKNV